MRILQELDINARQPIAAIAKKIGLSKELTSYRIRQLEKKQIISDYYSLYNVAKLGYNLYKVYIKLQNLSKKNEEEFIRYLGKIKQVGLIATSSGNYDLEVGIVGKNLVEFHEILEQIIKDYGIYIKAKDVTTNIEMWQDNRKYLFDENPKIEEYHYFAKEKSEDYDKKDEEIMRCLAHEGRKTNTEIEKVLRISRKVVGNRIKNLMKKSIILGFRPIIKREKLDLAYFRILVKLQSIKEERLKQMLYQLKINKNVVYVIKCIGPWELEIEIEIENSKKCHDIIRDLKQNFSDIIADTQMIEIFEDHKYEFVMN